MEGNLAAHDVTATFCATLVDEWVRGGVTHAMIAPGSRSTPLALALAERFEITVEVFHDERSAAFAALGSGLAAGVPAVALCSSGTAAAHFHAAVIEADLSNVPMIVCTADRPPELRDTGAAQTIDQTKLYGSAVRWFHDPGVPDHALAHTWRGLGARALADACGLRPGPVHLNLPFREPLLGTPGVLPPARTDVVAWSTTKHGSTAALPDHVVEALDQHRGVIIAGRDARPYDPERVHYLADTLGWPVIADPRSGCRIPRPTTVGAADALVRHSGFAADHAPHVVLRIGEPPASKALGEWIRASEPVEIHLSSTESWSDPRRSLSVRLIGDIDATVTAIAERLVGRGSSTTPWLARWRTAEARAQTEFDVFDAHRLTEPAVARTVTEALPAGAALVVASSMPIRDVEWFMAPRDGLRVFSNRGANGIDGVISTAIGVAAATRAPTAVLIGDVAFMHDSSSLTGLMARGLNLTIVVNDNDGGGIFSFLPQATQVRASRYEQLFATPHGTDLAALAGAHGIPARTVTTRRELRSAVAGSGTSLVRVASERHGNVADHESVNQRVIDALGQRP